ncbi:MAG TPA: DUF748 domain-containing protein [Candidatus Omnitrophota bacterium]|nr:DUF748 domain-containing protein [Candidatus Omnitrophota bacterium]HPT38603.1 DUF748 domain-containing protein [Candidatus Omnitrophota bacterium]
MKKKFKIIFWICGILLVFFLVANILIGIYAPRIVEQQIQQNLKLKSHLGKITLSFPFTITLERLEIGQLASIKKISLSPNLLALLFGKVVIHGLTIVEPVITLEQSAEGKLNLPVLEQKGKSPDIYLTSLNLRDGKIIFTDKKVSPEGFQVILAKLNIKVNKVALPVTSLATNFSVSAQLFSRQAEVFGEVTFSGWLDYPARDLDAELEVKHLDITKFSVYYGNFISNRKLSSANLDLVSTFNSKNNALRISTKFNLSNLVYADAQQELLNLDLTKNALDLFTDTKGNLNLEFDIDTLLDNPALSQEKLQKIILKAAGKNLAAQSPEQLVDKVATIIDQYKGVGKELKAIFGQ